MKTNNNNVFNIYIKSIQLEKDVDSMYQEYFGIRGLIKLIPRTFVFHKIIKKYNKIITVVTPLLILIWVLLFHHVYILYNFIKLFIKTLGHCKKKLDNCTVYLDTSDNKFFSFINREDENFPKLIIAFPLKRYKSSIINDLKYISIFNLSSILILLKSAFLSSLYVIRLFLSKNYKLTLYSYSAFTWLWTFFLLKKEKPKSIWISNHYDRWTVLVSSLSNIEITIVQHGKMYLHDHIHNIKMFPNFSQKIGNIRKIYVINMESTKYFLKYIENKNVEFVQVESKLQFIKWRNSNISKYKVLIIGHPFYAHIKFQIEMIEHFYNLFKNEVDICYKYHPSKIGTEIFNKNIWHLKNKFQLPDADIIISCGSTIDDEIPQFTKSEILHYDYNNRNSMERLFEIVNNKLSNQ